MTTRRLDERDLDQALHGWLREDDERAADRTAKVARILDRVDETRQRRRWWPLIPFGRRAVHSAEDHASTRRRAPLAAIASLMILVVGTAAVLYSANQPPPRVALVPGALPAVAEDVVLLERMDELWAGVPDQEAAMEVYAEDAVHTSLWTDRVDRVVGAEAIAEHIRASEKLASREVERTRVQDALTGARRYISVHADVGDMPCLLWITDERITRHDCILPMASFAAVPFEPGAPPADVSREALASTIVEAWQGDRSALDRVASPDIVHTAAFENRYTTYEGIDKYWSVASVPAGPYAQLGPAIDLAAPEGERRWADYSAHGGGTLCTFWSRGDKIIRHDCVVPMAS